MTDRCVSMGAVLAVFVGLASFQEPYRRNALAAEPRLIENEASASIYQRILDSDENAFSVARLPADGDPFPSTDLVIDLQNRVGGRRSDDEAPEPLFQHVDEARFQTGTYPEFIALLDNFVVNFQESESHTPEEAAEIDRFLEKALQTRPMQLAFDYISQDLEPNLSKDQFREDLERIWFAIYTNHFGTPLPNCTGFEHVFVGEGKFRLAGHGLQARLGEISGYHNWVKYYLDEQAGRVNYLGHHYGLPGEWHY